MDYTIELDADTGILVCRITGFLDEATAREYGLALHDGIAAARRKVEPLRVLIDNRTGRVAAPVAAKMLMEKIRNAKRAEDRTAIIVPNSLGKLQAKQVTTSEHEIFMSEGAARTWLLAYADKPIIV